MKRRYYPFAALLLVVLLTAVLIGGCSPQDSGRMKVVTSTSLLEYIVQQVGGDHVEVVNLVPPTQHPGNFDVKPADIQKLNDAALFLLHGWPGEGYADKLIESADNPDLSVVKVVVEGNWMIPEMQAEATAKVADVLSAVDSRHAEDYQKAAQAYEQRITAEEADIKSRLTVVNPPQVNVISAAFQADFMQWAGFNVVATYGNTTTLTPQVLQEMVDRGREANVTLIVDNLHSGKDAGAGIAEELGIARIILLNFPGGYDNTETWEKAISKNVDLILEALRH